MNISHTFMWIVVGATLALVLNGTISTAINPMLASLKLSVAAPGA